MIEALVFGGLSVGGLKLPLDAGSTGTIDEIGHGQAKITLVRKSIAGLGNYIVDSVAQTKRAAAVRFESSVGWEGRL